MSVRHHSLWADPRMAEAYDLVYEVLRANSTSEDSLSEVRDLLDEIDKADRLLAGVIHDRRLATRTPKADDGEVGR